MFKIIVALTAILSTQAFAQHFEVETVLLSPSEIEKVIGQFPKKGSAAEAQDFKVLMDYQSKRTAKDCEQAKKDEDTSVGHIFAGILSKDEADRMSAFMLKAYASSGINAYIAKKTFKRPRPYDANKNIKPCISLEDSYAYPSGHTMIARVYARILSQVYPERAEKLLERASAYSMNRVLGGVHHPSDIKAGEVLADYMAKKAIDTDDFVSELADL